MMSHRTWICAVFVCGSISLTAAAEEEFDPERLEKQVLVTGCTDPLQLEVLDDGRILFIERGGTVKLYHPGEPRASQVGVLCVSTVAELGLLGLACDLSFDRTGWIYLVYCPEDPSDRMRLSRFTLRDDRLDLKSEILLLDYAIDVPLAAHMGGGLYMDRRGNLHLGTGDNCFPIPELPVDRRPDRKSFDAMRSSANSRDLRGKVLRIHPEQDGTYSIPEGNLFTDPVRGRPEIYAMGCRNPFRVTVDEETGVVFWGDVGPNIQPDLELGPNGYDEINRAQQAGNFGWPMFVGPNEAYRDFDFETRQPGRLFDVNRAVNNSPNNTGLKELPAPLPAFIWYPSRASDDFPTMGIGGRSAMAGPVVHLKELGGAPLRLHNRFDGRLIIYDWTRNWIQTVTIDDRGRIQDIEPFMPESVFGKPIDMELERDGTLYLIEYGDKWRDNTDAEIVRIVYRRGNRSPKVVLTAEPAAGRHPLTVRLNGKQSSDQDDDPLGYVWQLNGQPVSSLTGPAGELTLEKPGRYEVRLTVTDDSGEASHAVTEIRVGNAAPEVRLAAPVNGSFVDWGQTIRYRIVAADEEDGTTTDGSIASRRVLMNCRQRTRRRVRADGPAAGDEMLDPGLALMRKTTCFSCHTTNAPSAGPPYREVGLKYADDSEARQRLAQKVVAGGAGVWGSKPMPPHPQHTLAQTRLMIDWIFSLAHDDSAAPVPGVRGFFWLEELGLRGPDSGVVVLTAEYTDNGVSSIPGVLPIRGEDECVLHIRRKRAAAFDRRHEAEPVEVFERGVGLVMQFAAGDWVSFEDVRLTDIDRVQWNTAAAAGIRGVLSLRLDKPDGPELARVIIKGKSDVLGDVYFQQVTPIDDPGGLHDLYVTAATVEELSGGVTAAKPLRLAWLEFLDSPAAAERKRLAREATKQILLVATRPDHVFGTHMYTQVCEILAACLNNLPNIEALVCPDLDWPADERLLDEADAIVYYSRPAGDILLASDHREKYEQLLKRGVGFVAIHWATAVNEELGPDYEAVLGGWFNFAFSGLRVDRKLLQQLVPGHPVLRGWDSYDHRDEFYLNVHFHPDVQPLVGVRVDGHDQTVAWAHHRTDGGRSFGTTLGHFHDNYTLPEFRRLIVNGILWTAGVDVPEAGAPVIVDSEILDLPEPRQRIVREWRLQDLLPLPRSRAGSVSFTAGERLFRRAACIGCHKIGDRGGTLGPDLTDVSARLAHERDPGAALLRELVEPSYRIEDRYQTTIFVLKTGQVIAGIVLEDDNGVLRVAANPVKPEEVLEIPVDDIEERQVSRVSMMPAGVVNTLTKEEIIALLSYVESGGYPEHPIYRTIPSTEP